MTPLNARFNYDCHIQHKKVIVSECNSSVLLSVSANTILHTVIRRVKITRKTHSFSFIILQQQELVLLLISVISTRRKSQRTIHISKQKSKH